MRVLYHFPNVHNLYAGRFIYEGYRDAFVDLGHDFFTFTNRERLGPKLDEVRPDIFITATHAYYFNVLDLPALQAFRSKGMKVFVNTDPLEYPTDPAHSLGRRPDLIEMIRSNRFGDAFFSYRQPERMRDFEQVTGQRHHTILLAADKRLHFPVPPDPKLASDAVFIGACLPRKRATFRRLLDPLRASYDVRIYGRDWTRWDRAVGFVQRASQYLNLGVFDRLRPLELPLELERAIYSSTKISLNVHESQQRESGEDFNERTFKIPACGAFELCDHVAAIRRYFAPDELVLATDDEWLPTFEYYVHHDEERRRIQESGTGKVLQHHTYHNRVAQILEILADLERATASASRA